MDRSVAMTHALIIGAGIGGLTAALALHEQGMTVSIAESAPELRPLGVGINLLPHGASVLIGLGLGPALAATGIETRALEYRTRFGQLIHSDPRGRAAGLPVPQYSIHRGALQFLILDHARATLPPTFLRTGLRLADFVQDAAGVRARFECGTEIAADLMVGADGVHSRVCALLHPTAPKLHGAGITMWRGAVETPRLLDGRTMLMAGNQDRKAVIYPISREADDRGRSVVNWVAELRTGPETIAVPDWTAPARLEDFLWAFEDWHFETVDVPALFRATETMFVYPMVDRDRLDAWSVGRVTLLGDAAHPMYPIGSNGASQAILDARVLADALAGTADVPAALAAYDAARREPAWRVVQSNRALGPERMLQLAHERVHSADDDVGALVPRAEIEGIITRYRAIAGFDVASLTATH